MTHPTDDEIMELAVRYLGEHAAHASTGLHRFARALLAEQARTEPTGLTDEQLRDEVKRRVESSGLTQENYAMGHGYSPQYLSDFLTGKRKPGPAILEGENMACVTRYVNLNCVPIGPEMLRAAPLLTHKAEDAPSDSELLDSRGNIRSDLKSSAYCVGNEYKPFHPRASHVRPEWRDGWNACFVAAIAQERKA